MRHEVQITGKAIVAGVAVKCSCGWRDTVWFEDLGLTPGKFGRAWAMAEKLKRAHESNREEDA